MLFRIVTTNKDLEDFKSILIEAKLPIQDIELGKQYLLAAFGNGIMIGTGALETVGDYGLLRSLSVRDILRNRMIGSKIVNKLIEKAKSQKLKSLFLLTETAHGYFVRKGFADVDRASLPEEIGNTYQFKIACPSSAKAMMLML